MYVVHYIVVCSYFLLFEVVHGVSKEINPVFLYMHFLPSTVLKKVHTCFILCNITDANSDVLLKRVDSFSDSLVAKYTVDEINLWVQFFSKFRYC
jgi:hypothetical protein